jgi:cytochrome bd-type quinol oxidase subunit 1
VADVRSTENRLRFLGAISAIEGLFYLAYAFLVVIGISRDGLTGPSQVANASGVTLEVLIFAIFGAAMLGVSFGWFGRRRWARAPFALAQVLALVVSVPLIGATELLQQVIAVGVTIVALVGTFMAFTPRVTQQLHGDEVARESN